MNIIIREATLSDAEAISHLSSSALGYLYPVSDMTNKLHAVLTRPQDRVYVAVFGSLVVGYIHANIYDLLYAPTMVNIMGLAVSADYRRIGIGKALMEAAETWTRSIGCQSIRLNSGGTRREAHLFYRSCGFCDEKEQLRFIKELL